MLPGMAAEPLTTGVRRRIGAEMLYQGRVTSLYSTALVLKTQSSMLVSPALLMAFRSMLDIRGRLPRQLRSALVIQDSVRVAGPSPLAMLSSIATAFSI